MKKHKDNKLSYAAKTKLLDMAEGILDNSNETLKDTAGKHDLDKMAELANILAQIQNGQGNELELSDKLKNLQHTI